jgi:hypothetical protein
MANPKRTTNLAVNVEYKPIHTVRTSNFAVMVEYKPVEKVRLTDIMIMVEYRLPPPRVLGPAGQNA